MEAPSHRTSLGLTLGLAASAALLLASPTPAEAQFDQRLEPDPNMPTREGFDTGRAIFWARPNFVPMRDPDWQSLEEGKSYPIRVQFGRAAPWEADATAGRMDGFPVLFFRFRDLNVVREFMRKREVAFIYRNRTIAVLSLSGSFRAFQEVIRCQEQVNAGLIDSGTDPFSGGLGRRFGYGDDPFR